MSASKTRENASGEILTSVEQVDWSKYDFIDLGSSKGGSLRHCINEFGVTRGLGVDIDEAKAEQTAKAGYDVLLGDATTLDLEGVVRFVSMFDFLEHLVGLDMVESVLRQASNWATEFLTINHPSFEGEGLIEHLGFRQYWWDWSAHKAHPQVADYCRMFEALDLSQHVIRYRGRVVDTSHATIIPTGLPRNQSHYDVAVHPPKPLLKFRRPLWRSQRITVGLGEFSGADWRAVLAAVDRRGDASHRSLMRGEPSRGGATAAPAGERGAGSSTPRCHRGAAPAAEPA